MIPRFLYLVLTALLMSVGPSYATSDKIYIEEIHVATLYLDGGSFVVSATTSDNRNLYIFVDRSQSDNGAEQIEIALLNAENLLESPETLTQILVALDVKYRTHFGGKRPSRLIEFVASDSASKLDRDIFGLVFVLEAVCNRQAFELDKTSDSPGLECELYDLN